MTECGMPLVCVGCGLVLPGPEELRHPFRCPAARPGDDIDHVVRRVADPACWRDTDLAEPHPFLRYRRRLTSHGTALACGMSDAAYVGVVRLLDAAVREVDGRGFGPTPFAPSPRLAEALGFDSPGAPWVKDETGNVAGSHKGRHLLGVMLYLEVIRRLEERGALPPAPWRDGAEGTASTRLAIASCGNAALAAAVVSRAAGWPLDVFVPPSAEPRVLERLHALGARVAPCPRRAGEAGDPCYLRFREALAAGAVPFCCQGPDNGLTIEGGETVVYEMLDQLGDGLIDRVFVQVGGGAFASACVQAFAEALAAGRIPRLPRLHAVQTASAFPLKRAYDRVVARLLGASVEALGPEGAVAAHAETILESVPPARIRRAVQEAALTRSSVMWPWETEPHSLAYGILDDETYDWRAIVEGMLLSGGWPVVASEEDIARANTLGHEATGIDVCHTGSAGLAGLLHVLEGGGPLASRVRRERVAVVFTGVRRG